MHCACQWKLTTRSWPKNSQGPKDKPNTASTTVASRPSCASGRCLLQPASCGQESTSGLGVVCHLIMHVVVATFDTIATMLY